LFFDASEKIFFPASMELFMPIIIKKGVMSQKVLKLSSFQEKTKLLSCLKQGRLLRSVTLRGSYDKRIVQEFFCNLHPNLDVPGSSSYQRVFVRG
jgi:hypothetical protein